MGVRGEYHPGSVGSARNLLEIQEGGVRRVPWFDRLVKGGRRVSTNGWSELNGFLLMFECSG